MKELSALRGEIDQIDDQLLSLFLRRMEMMGEVAAAKAAAGVPLTDSARESQILERLAAQAPGREAEVRALFQAIFQAAKGLQVKSSS
ncbi:MAG: chorismate mutase [Oligosphaeraceae bacterium]